MSGWHRLIRSQPLRRYSYADVRTEEGRAWLRSRSPLYKVDQICRPLLIAHGANDVRCKLQESDQIVAAMRIEWAVREGIARRDKVAITGVSYGGYATLVGLTFTPEVFCCGVSIVGISNLVTLLENMPAYWAGFDEFMFAKRGLPVTYVVYPDEGHGFLRPESRTSFNAISEAFFATHLGGRCEPFGNDLDGSTLEVRGGIGAIAGLPECLDRQH
jgi:dipeptidyl aminopeptidase/acylaminoacyl peptidase